MNRFFLSAISAGFLCVASATADEADTPLGKSMEESSKAMKKFRTMDKKDWSAGAQAARDAAEGIRKGMAYIPALVKEMPEGKEKSQAIADYKRLMGLSYASLSELELAYLAEDPAKIAAAMKKIKDVKKEGHKKYEDD